MEGKRAVRLNGLRHGLLSRDVVLPGEDEKAFEELRCAVHQELDVDDPDLAPALSALDRITASAPAFHRQPSLITGQASTGHSLPGAREYW